MAKFVEENERIKHEYATYLRHAKGQDDSSIDGTVRGSWLEPTKVAR
jgi:hypothetical protein